MARQSTQWLIFFALIPSLFAGTIDPRYSDSGKCFPCHTTIVKDWRTSLHAKSHFSKNELYQKMLHFVAKKRHKSFAAIEIRCAQCHNPHVNEAVNENLAFDAAFGLGQESVRKAMNNSFIKDGVNCIVCHNIKSIHLSKDPGKRGKDTIVWGKSDTMVGPFKDAKSPYHKTAYAPFFKEESNKLCFVCHYNERSVHRIKIGTTGEEYEAAKSDRSCVECHMGPLKKGRSVQKRLGRETTAGLSRSLRRHLFGGVRNSDILGEAIDMDYKQVGRKVTIMIKNLLPHRLPTGFGGRILRLKAIFSDANGNVVGEGEKDFGLYAVDRRGEPTVVFLAAKITEDSRFEAFETKKIGFEIPQSAKSIKIELLYYLIDPQWAKRLGVHSKEYRQAYSIASLHMTL